MYIKYTRELLPDFLELCNLLDTELNKRVGGAKNRQKYIALNTLDDIRDFFIAYENVQPVGGACLKKNSDISIEIKRVFVKEAYRKTGIAKDILQNIFKYAISENYTEILLETGSILFEATQLYKKMGFYVIPNYGPYINMKHSICMKKDLKG